MYKSIICTALLGLASAGCIDDFVAWCIEITDPSNLPEKPLSPIAEQREGQCAVPP